MSKDNDTSSLEKDIEDTRERLAATIDQLIYRSNPKTIANRQIAQIKAVYVDELSGQPRTDNILKTVGGVLGTVVLIVVLRKITS